MNSIKEDLLNKFRSIDFHSIKDHPNILIAASFWDKERYCAAKTCYRFMREIDDLIDNHKASHRIIGESERNEFRRNVSDWLKMMNRNEECNTSGNDLSDTIKKFRIPSWPLEAFAGSMIYDIFHDGFPTIDSFMEYAQGASVAPASIFVHLAGLTEKDGRYEEPSFSVKETAIPCAIFSYLVHIIRDFQKDQKNNLNYFSDDKLAENGLSLNDLREIAGGAPVSDNFRNLISDYYMLAGKYRLKTMEKIREIKPLIEPIYQFSLEVIFDLYLMVFEKIDVRNGLFTTEELNPTPEETRERVYKTITSFSPVNP